MASTTITMYNLITTIVEVASWSKFIDGYVQVLILKSTNIGMWETNRSIYKKGFFLVFVVSITFMWVAFHCNRYPLQIYTSFFLGWTKERDNNASKEIFCACI